MKRILLITFVVFLAVLTLASCNNDNKPSGTSGTNGNPSTTGTSGSGTSSSGTGYPGTTIPGTTDSAGTTNPGTTNPGTTNPAGTTNPGKDTNTDGTATTKENNTVKPEDTTKKPDTTKTPDTTQPPKDPYEGLTEDEKYYRKLALDFNTSDFGKIIIFGSDYGKPKVYPTNGQHPRVMVNESSLNKVRSAFDADANRNARNQVMALSQKVMTGKFISRVSSQKSNATRSVLMGIEAKAYRYLMTGEKLYGLQAIYTLKNAILTIDAEGMADPYRDYGILMYISACVYDWCYDLLTPDDMEQIVAGVQNKLAKRMEIGCPPSKDGAISHHNLECQLLRSYLSFAIAVYDEYPSVYNYVAGRLFNEIKPAQDFMLQSGKHWEGSGYGPMRTYYLMWGQILMSSMTNGKTDLIDSDALHRVCSSFTDFLFPGKLEGHSAFSLGDQCNSYLSDYYQMAFFAGNYFKDASLKGLSEKMFTKDTTNFDPGTENFAWITSVTYLILNDTNLKSTEWWRGKSLVNMLSYPGSAVFARSSWTDPNAVAVFMNMNEYYSSSHSHMDCGSFQIYYKGILAADSGKYDGYGSAHHYAYSMQTISSNSLLIYNHDKVKALSRLTHPYSGGQTLVSDISRYICSYTLDAAKKSKSMNQATVIGRSYKADNNTYRYSYLAGDMTKAYDAITVDEVTRHMISVMTDDAKCPMVFVTFDRVTADSADYKKTVLLHSKTKPEVTSDGYVIIKNGGGKLVTQSLITDMKATVFGGNGAEYTVNGKVYKPNGYDASNPEYRIELNPTKANKTDRMLTVMYVTDATNNASPVKAKEIDTDTLAGAVIFNRAILFAKEQGELAGTHSFSLSDNAECYVGGVKAGKWQITSGGKTQFVTVAEGEGLLTFTAEAGAVEISYAG